MIDRLKISLLAVGLKWGGGWRHTRGVLMSESKSSKDSASASFEDKVQQWQDGIELQFRKLGRGSWARILRMARKPTSQEFKQTNYVCGIGMFILGFIGFVVLVTMDDVLPWIFEALIG